jgi:two-component system response regulator VicR
LSKSGWTKHCGYDKLHLSLLILCAEHRAEDKMSYRARVLCIDDEPGVVELISLILKPQNIQVDGVNSGQEGLEAMRKDPPDAVLLDIMMPEMDGWEVYKQMRADDSLKNIPVIVVTARNSSFEEIIARERAGVNDYVTKPFVPNDLRKSLARVLGLDESST